MLVVSFLSAMLGKPRLHVFVWIMSICSPWFPGTTGPIRPWSDGLGLDSGMALSSSSDFGVSGAAGFAALGTVENKNKKTQRESALVSVCACAELQRLAVSLLSFDISFIHREGYGCMCSKRLRSGDESTQRGRTS